MTEQPSGEINQSMYDFSQGYATLKAGDSAVATMQSLKALTESTTSRFRFHDGKDIVEHSRRFWKAK